MVDNPVAIRDWHSGKILLLWGLELLIFFVVFGVTQERGGFNFGAAVFFWLPFLIPAFVITWKWLSGKETHTEVKPKPRPQPQPKPKGSVKRMLGWLLLIMGIGGISSVGVRGPVVESSRPTTGDPYSDLAVDLVIFGVLMIVGFGMLRR